MSLPLPDYNKKINKGDISFVYKGVYHPIQWFGDDPYRPRVETIIIKNGNQIFLRWYDEKGDYDYQYRIPGGSLDNDSTKIKQAENEINEEALLTVKDIYQSPISYFENYPDGFLLKNGDICIAYKGTYTEVFVADYKGKQDKSKIDKHDLDDDMANNGKFHYITNVCESLRPEHIDAILGCPFVNDKTKSAMRIILSRKISPSTIDSKIEYVVEGKVENPRKHHYNTYMMIELMDNEQPFGVEELANNIDENIWLATDVHIGEPKDTWENKRRRILTSINKKVKMNDHLLFLGDMVGHDDNVTLDMLKGFIKGLLCKNVYLILGNNDYFTMEEYKSIGFKAVTDKFIYKNYIFTHCTLPDVPEGYLNIHGHIHGSKLYYDMDPAGHIDVWGDNYSPIQLKDIVQKYESGEYVGHRKDYNLMTSTTESINTNIVPIFTVNCRYNSAFGVTTRTLTGSNFNHSSIALYSDLSEMYSYVRNLSGLSEKNRKTGFDTETLDYYTYRDDDAIISVNAVFINKDDFNNLKNRISKYLSSSTKTLYDYGNLFRMIFGISINDNNINDNKMVCSEFVAKMLTLVNVDLPKPANLMLPDDIDDLSKTNTNVINVFTGRIKDYDKKKVDKVVKEAISLLTESSKYNIPSNQKYFFLSKTSMDDEVLIPRIPDNFMTKNGYEDNTTPRVCFSKSIDGALTALSRNLEGEELFVHIPDESHKIYNPTIKEVPDKNITDEVWIKEKVNVRMIGKIKVLKAKPNGKDYTYGDNKKATIYFWNWKWLWRVDENGKTIKEPTKESIVQEISAFDSDSKVMANLSRLHKKTIDDYTLKPYIKDFSALEYIDTSEDAKGFIYFDDEENPVAYVNVLNESEGVYVIQQLQVLPKYKKCGLTSQLIDVAVRELKANKVTVSTRNEELHKAYLNEGFKDINETQFSYTMGRGNIATESVVTESIKSSQYMEKPVTQENINKYKASAPYLKHIKINKNTKGVMLIDDDTCVGIINSEKKSDGVWIQALEVTQKYKGTGIGTKLLNYGINTLGATVLSVRKTNNIALNMYKKAGFKVINDTGYQYIMRRGNITTESIVTESNVNNMEKFEFIDLKNSRAIKYLQTESYWKKHGQYHMKNSVGEIAISKTDDCLAGYIMVNNKVSGSEGFITPLYVVPKYRNMGLGTKLLEDGINKYGAVDLVVKNDNDVAMHIYKQHGFVIIGKGNEKNSSWMKLKSKLTDEDTVIESVVTEVSAFDSNNKVMSNINISTLHKRVIDEHTLRPYLKEFNALNYIDLSEDAKGFIFFDDEENPVAYVNVVNDSEGVYSIQQLQVLPQYKKCGLTSQLIDIAVRELRANKVVVSKRNEELHEEYLREGFRDIDETQFSYTIGRGIALHESVVTESIKDDITKVKLYHGSNKCFDTLEPIGLDFGNKFVEPGWSVFMFKKREYAENWAIFQVLKNNIYRGYVKDDNDDRLFIPRFDAKTYKCIIEEYTYQRCIDVLSNIGEPLYGYVYEADVDKKDVHIGNSSFLDEYTVRKTLIPVSVTQIRITPSIIKDRCTILPADKIIKINAVSMKSRNQMFNRDILKSLLNTTDYIVNGRLARKLYDDIRNGDLIPGEDLTEYIQTKGYTIAHLYPTERVYHYIRNTDVNDINKH